MWGKSNGLAGAYQAMLEGKWLNPANLLTGLRAALVPPIILLLVYRPGPPYNSTYHILAGVIFVIAALTDKLDGYYARKNDTITRLGQFLDPLADKLLIIPIMIVLWYPLDLLPLWVVCVVVTREIFVSAVRFVGVKRQVTFPASWSGKIKMFLQVVVVSILIFFPDSHGNLGVLILVYTMAAVTAYSGLVYVYRARREVFNKRPQKSST